MKNTIRGGIAAIGIAGAMATGITLAGSAGAAPAAPTSLDHDTLVYLQMLNNDGLVVTDTAEAIRFAGAVCVEMRNGWDAHQIASYNLPVAPASTTYQNMLDQVEDAAIVFCPGAWQAVINAPTYGSTV
jgi:hypothetical protein